MHMIQITCHSCNRRNQYWMPRNVESPYWDSIMGWDYEKTLHEPRRIWSKWWILQVSNLFQRIVKMLAMHSSRTFRRLLETSQVWKTFPKSTSRSPGGHPRENICREWIGMQGNNHGDDITWSYSWIYSNLHGNNVVRLLTRQEGDWSYRENLMCGLPGRPWVTMYY